MRFIALLLSLVCVSAATNSIIFDGTSLTFGTGAPAGKSCADQLLATLGPEWRGTNFGVRGQTGADMLKDFATQIAPQIDPQKHQALVFDMGINDLTSGEPVETVKARYDQYFDACVAAGLQARRIFIRPISPSFFSGNFTSANRSNVNAYLLNKYPHNVIPPEWEPRIFANGANSNTNYFSDLTHPNERGYALEAAALKRKMTIEGFLPADLDVAFYAGVTILGEIGATYRIDRRPHSRIHPMANSGPDNTHRIQPTLVRQIPHQFQTLLQSHLGRQSAHTIIRQRSRQLRSLRLLL